MTHNPIPQSRPASKAWRFRARLVPAVAILVASVTTAHAARTVAAPLDLAVRFPNATSVCAAIAPMKRREFDFVLAKSALPVTPVKDVDDPRRAMGELAWGEASVIQYSVDYYAHENVPFRMYRVTLQPGQSQAWVFSTSVGNLGNPILWVFDGGRQPTVPGHLLGQFGTEDSGPFTTEFVRFRSRPFVINRWRSANGTWSMSVSALEPQRELCWFGSPAAAE